MLRGPTRMDVVKARVGIALGASVVLFVSGVLLRRASDGVVVGSVSSETLGILFMLVGGVVGFAAVLLWPVDSPDERSDHRRSVGR